MKRSAVIVIGIAVVLAETALWHGPLGAADRLTGKIERAARGELKRLEMPAVTARLERAPLRRQLVLSGPADDFQQSELVRILDSIPAVSGVRWASPPSLPSDNAK